MPPKNKAKAEPLSPLKAHTPKKQSEIKRLTRRVGPHLLGYRYGTTEKIKGKINYLFSALRQNGYCKQKGYGQ
jgi:hypothetical protein